jgi:O-antigen/teichoic acid export membrane protein
LHQLLNRVRATLARRHNLRAHFWQTLSNYFQHVIGLTMSVILARLLAPAEFGRFAYVAALYEVILVSIPCASGMGQILISDGGKTHRLFDSVYSLILRFLLVEIAAGLILAAYFFITYQIQEAILSVGLTFFYAINRLAGAHRCDLEARGNFKPIFLFGFWSSIIAGFAAVLLAFFGAGVYSLLAPPAAGALTAIIVFRLLYGKPYNPPSLTWAEMIYFFRTSVWTWLVSFSAAIQSRADRIIVGSELSDRNLGYYNRALNFSPMAYLLLSSFLGNAATSAYARADNDIHRLRLLGKTCALVFSFGLVNFAIWHCFSDPLVPWIFGEQWIGAIPVFQALAPLSICYALRDIPSTFLLGQKKFRLFGMLNLLSVILFLVGIFLLKDRLSIVNVAWILQLSMAGSGVIALGIIASRILRRLYK